MCLKKIKFHWVSLMLGLTICLLSFSKVSAQNIYLGITSLRVEPLHIYDFQENYYYSKNNYNLLYIASDDGSTRIRNKWVSFGLNLPASSLLLDYNRFRLKGSFLPRLYFNMFKNAVEANSVDFAEYPQEFFLSIPVQLGYKFRNKYKSTHSPFVFVGGSYNLILGHVNDPIFDAIPEYYDILYNDRNHYWTLDVGLGYTIGPIALEVAGKKRINYGPYQIAPEVYYLEVSLHLFKWVRSSSGEKNRYFKLFKRIFK